MANTEITVKVTNLPEVMAAIRTEVASLLRQAGAECQTAEARAEIARVADAVEAGLSTLAPDPFDVAPCRHCHLTVPTRLLDYVQGPNGAVGVACAECTLVGENPVQQVENRNEVRRLRLGRRI